MLLDHAQIVTLCCREPIYIDMLGQAFADGQIKSSHRHMTNWNTWDIQMIYCIGFLNIIFQLLFFPFMQEHSNKLSVLAHLNKSTGTVITGFYTSFLRIAMKAISLFKSNDRSHLLNECFRKKLISQRPSSF